MVVVLHNQANDLMTIHGCGWGLINLVGPLRLYLCFGNKAVQTNMVLFSVVRFGSLLGGGLGFHRFLVMNPFFRFQLT